MYTRPLGGVSAPICELDLPQRQGLVPGSPAAPVGPDDRQQGELGERVVLPNSAGHFSCLHL